MFAIDLSHHNGQIDFFEVIKNDPKVDFIYLKASQGVGYVDPKLKANALAVHEQDIPIGYYHYASLNTMDVVQDAKAEAQFFMDTIRPLPLPNLPLVLDIEENKANVPKDKVLLWIKTFFEKLSTSGYSDYVLYSYASFLDSNLPKDHGLGNVRLWIAAYVNLAKPKLPRGWDKYHIWQYSAKGKVKGVPTDCDINKTLINIF